MTHALLLMDFQNGIVARHDAADALANAGRALETARERGIPVIFVRVAFRAGHPEISPRNKAFAPFAAAGQFVDGDAAADLCADLKPAADEPVVTKKRFSAFAGSDLDVLLRGRGVEHLVLAGVSTSGVVLSTVRQAGDLDYGLTVLSDACADADPDAHRVLLENVFPRQADVMTVDGWISTP